jgi:hypothetical protein
MLLDPAHGICSPAGVKGAIGTMHHVTIIGHQGVVMDWFIFSRWVDDFIRMLGLPPP